MSILKVFKKAFNSPKTKYNIVIIAVLALIFSSLTATTSLALADSNAQAGSAFLSVLMPDNSDDSYNSLIMNDGAFMSISRLPSFAKASDGQPVIAAKAASGKVVIVTAYSSTVDQTDSSPFITANGTYVRDGIIAANFLPFGAKVKFPAYSGDKVYIVADRMAKKNNHKIDIWMESRNAAMQFGVKRLAYEIVE